jgi:hypothetical protein
MVVCSSASIKAHSANNADIQCKAISVVVQMARGALVNLWAGQHGMRLSNNLVVPPSQAEFCTWRTWPGSTCCQRRCPASTSWLQQNRYRLKESTLSHVSSFELSMAAPRHCVSTMLCKATVRRSRALSKVKTCDFLNK